MVTCEEIRNAINSVYDDKPGAKTGAVTSCNLEQLLVLATDKLYSNKKRKSASKDDTKRVLQYCVFGYVTLNQSYFTIIGSQVHRYKNPHV